MAGFGNRSGLVKRLTIIPMNLVRKYASIFIVALASLFALAIVIDEYADYQRGQQDMLVVACEEFDSTDIEWNEGDDVEDWHFVCKALSPAIMYYHIATPVVASGIHRSFEQWRGLVRKYSPESIVLLRNAVSGMNPTWICTAFFLSTN